MPEYQYRPLNGESTEIRLLHVHPGSCADPVECSLRHASVENLPTYETISYCWGARHLSTTIDIDGNELSIPISAAEVLYRFRHPGKSRVLWIDAVCINQNDLQERSLQVIRMHIIYASATTNLIWLGEDDGNTQAAIESMNKLIKEIEEETDSFKTMPFSGGPNFHLHRLSGLKQELNPQPFLQMCSKPWSGRLWVVQEASLAASNVCYCGPYSFDLTTLLRVSKWIWTKRDYIDLGAFADARKVLAATWRISDFADKDCGWFFHALSKGWFRDDNTDDGVSLTHHLLTNLRNFACSEPFDHVFGLVGLYRQFSWKDELPELLRPDYSKSIREVFANATKQAISEGENLACFGDIYHRVDESQEMLDLPSWVPQWHLPWNLELDPTPIHRGYNSSGNWTFDSIESESGDTASIKLEGIFVDCAEGAPVSNLTGTFLEKSLTPKFLENVRSIVQSQSVVVVSGDDKAIASTLCAEENAEREQATEDDLKGYESLDAALQDGLNKTSEEGRRASRYAEAAWRACYRRIFFLTAGGRMGLGPQTMRAGDVLTILYGGEWPFLLRPCDGKYELIGPCYVYGIMGGQAVQEHGERGNDDVWFHIR